MLFRSQAHFNKDRHPRIQPAVYSVSITGPFDPGGAADMPSRRRIFVCRPDSALRAASGVAEAERRRPTSASEEAGCARRILSTLARRAYRRPVTDADLQVPLAFYKDARAEEGFEAGIEMALRAILTSTNFLFRIERDPRNVAPNTPYHVSDVELASRLSLFLWSSIPDRKSVV